MPSAPTNPHTSGLSQPATKLIVRLGPENGDVPTADDEVDYLIPLEISRTAGGRQLDHAVFQWDLGRSGRRLEDLQTPTGWTRQVEIRVPDSEDSAQTTLIFWGEITAQSFSLGKGESVTVTARIEEYHFGTPLRHYFVRNAHNGNLAGIDEDPLFNPLIDGAIQANKSSHTQQLDENNEYDLWVDYDSTRTEKARDDIQEEDQSFPILWKLPDAIQSISKLLNPAETFVLNPDTDPEADPEAAPVGVLTDSPAIKNIRFRRGEYLPTYLDELLTAHGFDWYIDVSGDISGLVTPSITLFKRGDGTCKQIYFQAIGDELDLAKHNVADFSLDVNVADLANEIECHGSLEQRELTLPLYRGWPEADDTLSETDLARTDPDSEYESKQDVWRLFVANEAGDFSELRTTVQPIPAAAPDFSAEFTSLQAVPVRREIEDCLTKDEQGVRRRPVIEWRPDATSDWEQVPASWSIGLLTDQIGIRFVGDIPPADLIAAGDDGELRITGTVTGDRRISATATRKDSSPNGRTVILFLDVSDRFHDRQVVSSGDFISSLDGDANEADTADDQTDLDDYAAKVQGIEDTAAMRATIPLFGLKFSYEIGDLIDKVDGRNISLNRNSEDAEEKKFLQITGIVWKPQEQLTQLIVEAVEDELA